MLLLEAIARSPWALATLLDAAGPSAAGRRRPAAGRGSSDSGAQTPNARARLAEAASQEANGYDSPDADGGGHAPIRCRNATIFPR